MSFKYSQIFLSLSSYKPKEGSDNAPNNVNEKYRYRDILEPLIKEFQGKY